MKAGESVSALRWQHCPMKPALHSFGRRWPLPQLATALGLSLLGHGLLLGALEPDAPRLTVGPAAPAAQARPASMQLRPAGAPDRAAAPAPPRVQPTSAQASPARPSAPALMTQAVAAGERPEATADPAPPLPQDLLLSPAPFSARYALTLQGRSGQARLHWQREEDGRYTLRLERWLDDGRPLPSWHSQGRWDARGLAPERFATAERGQEKQATNFRSSEGLISFSSSTEQQALIPGVQDRLSWWLQLAALAQAAPGRLTLGQGLQLPIVALRGPVTAWRFVVSGHETLVLPDGRVMQAIRLEGSAEGQPSQRLEVWLAGEPPALPLRLRQTWESQEISEYRLISVDQP